VKWQRITGRRRSSYDIFAHRVKAAAYQDTVPKFVEKLCHGLGLQSIDAPSEVITKLDANRDRVLQTLREETVYYVLMAAENALEKRKEKKKLEVNEENGNVAN